MMSVMTCARLHFPCFRQGICAKCEKVWILLLKVKPAAFPSLCLRSCMRPCMVASHRTVHWVSKLGGSPRGPPEPCRTPRAKAGWLVALPSIPPTAQQIVKLSCEKLNSVMFHRAACTGLHPVCNETSRAGLDFNLLLALGGF